MELLKKVLQASFFLGLLSLANLSAQGYTSSSSYISPNAQGTANSTYDATIDYDTMQPYGGYSTYPAYGGSYGYPVGGGGNAYIYSGSPSNVHHWDSHTNTNWQNRSNINEHNWNQNQHQWNQDQHHNVQSHQQFQHGGGMHRR